MRRAIGLVIIGVVLGLTVPVAANHVQEPSAPIQSLVLQLRDYPSGTPFVCDGSDVADFRNLRIEGKLTVANTPSEHFTVRLIRNSSIRAANGYDLWPHQNVAPHKARTSEIFQSSQSMGEEAGTMTVTARVVGAESGVVLVESCSFIIE